jgi:hypothetical protein
VNFKKKMRRGYIRGTRSNSAHRDAVRALAELRALDPDGADNHRKQQIRQALARYSGTPSKESTATLLSMVLNAAAPQLDSVDHGIELLAEALNSQPEREAPVGADLEEAAGEDDGVGEVPAVERPRRIMPLPGKRRRVELALRRQQAVRLQRQRRQAQQVLLRQRKVQGGEEQPLPLANVEETEEAERENEHLRVWNRRVQEENDLRLAIDRSLDARRGENESGLVAAVAAAVAATVKAMGHAPVAPKLQSLPKITDLDPSGRRRREFFAAYQQAQGSELLSGARGVDGKIVGFQELPAACSGILQRVACNYVADIAAVSPQVLQLKALRRMEQVAFHWFAEMFSEDDLKGEWCEALSKLYSEVALCPGVSKEVVRATSQMASSMQPDDARFLSNLALQLKDWSKSQRAMGGVAASKAVEAEPTTTAGLVKWKPPREAAAASLKSCTYCGKQGHDQETCWKKYPNRAPSSRRPSSGSGQQQPAATQQ